MGKRMISLTAVVSVLAMVLSLFGNLLMAKKNMLVFPVWITANVLWIVVNIISTFNGPMVINCGVKPTRLRVG